MVTLMQRGSPSTFSAGKNRLAMLAGGKKSIPTVLEQMET